MKKITFLIVLLLLSSCGQKVIKEVESNPKVEENIFEDSVIENSSYLDIVNIPIDTGPDL